MKRFNLFTIILTAGLFGSCAGQASDPILDTLLMMSNGGGTVRDPVTETVNLQAVQTGGSDAFLMNNSVTLPVALLVVDTSRTNLAGALVTIYDQTTNGQKYVSFNAISDPAGNVTGTLTLNPLTRTITAVVDYNGVQLQRDIVVAGLQAVRGTLVMDLRLLPAVQDSDGDGVVNMLDAYPNDPTRAYIVRYPADSRVGFYTLAFEDHYEGKEHAVGVESDGEGGDHSSEIDFNDYVARVNGEADLNAAGKLVRIRLNAAHVAGGVCEHDEHEHGDREHDDECRDEKGFFLDLKLPIGGKYTLQRKDESGKVVSVTEGKNVANGDFELLPSSTTTIAQSNTLRTQQFRPGMAASVEFILDSPIAADSVEFPYDLFVSHKKGKRQIHLPGRVFDENGNDLYEASNGFRWALFVPGSWKWPFEKENVHNGYVEFAPWYHSFEKEKKEWYKHADDQRVFKN